MKNFLILILLIGVGLFFYHTNPVISSQINHYLYHSLCDTPVTFTIGTIDSRFNLSQSDLIADTKQAIAIWGKYENHDLLILDPNSALKINMVYDQRQQLSTQIGNLENKLDSQKQNLDPAISAYEKDKTTFEQKLSDFENEVSHWNNQNGAPPDVYEKLMQEKSDLQKQADNLNQRARQLNITTQDYNSVVRQLNQTVTVFGQTIANRPEEGVYDPKNNSIDIYFNTDKNELIHTLAHEMGHALGLDHVANPESIMYTYSSKSITTTNEDKIALNNLCIKHPVWKIARDNILQVIKLLIQEIKTIH
jgi:hypothetical protein